MYTLPIYELQGYTNSIDVTVIMPKSMNHCSSKFVDESWLIRNGLEDPKGPLPGWYAQPISALGALQSASVGPDSTIANAIQTMKKNVVEQLPVVDADG